MRIASRTGTLSSSFRTAGQFTGLTLGSAAFSKQWRAVAARGSAAEGLVEAPRTRDLTATD